MADDFKELDKIGRETARLNDAIGRLSSEAQFRLGQNVPAEAFGERNKTKSQILKLRLLLNDLEAAASAAATSLRAKFGEDRGGVNLSMRRRVSGDPYAYFTTRLIDLFVDVHGLSKLTATTSGTRGESCYEFVDAVHLYAMLKPVGHEKLFKQLVRKRKAKKNPELPFYPIH